jgi:peptidoglycan-associated lipoprotein
LRTRVSVTVTVALLASFGLITGCAKRPGVTQATAPPPTATADVQPPSPPPAPPVARAPASAQSQPPAKPAEFVRSPALTAIHFDFDKWTIRKPDESILDANAAWLTANPQYLVLIEGHCDERGTNEYNVALAERRASATRNYLVARGVAASRILTISYGEERPECTDHNETCWARNRQARFLTRGQ